MDNTEICYMPLTEKVDAVKTKRLSPVEIMSAELSRIERINPDVNAYCTVLAESAMKQAQEAETMVMKGQKLGPLHGVPVAIKDALFTKGIRTTVGSKAFEHFVPEEDCVIVERLKAAGAIIVGKTNLPELCLAGRFHGKNPLFAETRNPWNLNHVPGSSSSGSAAAVGAGMSSMAIGTDGGGSIRIPASFCGIVGMKTSLGRVPRYPRFPPGWETMSSHGPITRTVRDMALTLEVIAGRDDRDFYSLPETEVSYLPFLGGDLKGLKIAWGEDFGHTPLDPEVSRITRAAAKTFEALGARVEAATPNVMNLEEAVKAVNGANVAVVHQDIVDKWREQMDPDAVAVIEQYKDLTAKDYVTYRQQYLQYWDGIRFFFEKYDLMLTPTVAIPAPELSTVVEEIAGVQVTFRSLLSFCYPFNITGQPAVSVPCGWTDYGLPVGLQIVGRHFDDLGVLKAAAAFEQAAPWADKRPPLD